MKGAVVAAVIAMAFGAASSTAALAQAKEASPGAVTSKSNAAALPTGGNAVQGMQGHSTAMSGNAGVAEPTTKSSEKARN